MRESRAHAASMVSPLVRLMIAVPIFTRVRLGLRDIRVGVPEEIATACR